MEGEKKSHSERLIFLVVAVIDSYAHHTLVAIVL